MTTKNRGLLVSIITGLVAILLVLAALLLHVIDADMAMAEPTDAHSATETTTTMEMPGSPHATMSDGTVMDMEGMSGATQDSSPTTAETAGHAAAETVSMNGMHMMVDWQAILLILALVAIGTAFGTAINAYLRRQVEAVAISEARVRRYAQEEAGCE